MVSQNQVKAGIMIVIGLMLALQLGASMLPNALATWFNTSTGSWGTLASTLWTLVPAFGLLGILFYFLGQAFDIF